MPSVVSAARILDFFRDGFEHTAWRLETRREYAADQETVEYRQFLQGVAPPRDEDGPWFVNVRAQTATGRRIASVRLVDEPATDNQRYLLATTPDNLGTGEDIRYLHRSAAAAIGLGCEEDFWLFDSRVVARFNCNDTDRRMELTTDPEQVVRACRIRDAAWHHAARYEEFIRRVRSPM
ncbi:DUF6879 family protein [Streptomyces sp. ADI96-02]|uniref:DUF6879 family protein n=1 Tax=Streptomyces sp. ADI96-02 TaxID=1522760 RepID=UPI000F5595A9|nr:DUF6879 family protein [Streptomyces sp. ADI96-02]